MPAKLVKSPGFLLALAAIFVCASVLVSYAWLASPAARAQVTGAELTGPQGPPQHIQVIAEKETGAILFDGMVAPGETFAFTGTAAGDKIGPRALIKLDGVLRTTIKTDCNELIGPNLVSGDFAVIDGHSRDGGPLCPVPPPGTDCGVCEGDVTRLTLRYTGTLDGAQVRVTDEQGSVLFDGVVQPLQSFTFNGLRGGTQMGRAITLAVNGQVHATIDTSCEALMGPGLVAGDFEVMDGASKNSVPLCPMPPASLGCGVCNGGVTQITLQYVTYESGEVLARFVAGTPIGTITETVTAMGGVDITHLPDMDVWQIETPLGNEEFLVQGLLASGLVIYAEPNYRTSASAVPNDPLYASSQYGPQKVLANQAWDITVGSSGVVIGVVDTGVSASHQELAGRVLPGKDFVNDDNDAADDHGHGTHVAGIAAASLNNGVGIAGMSQASILPVKVLGQFNSGNTLNVANGIRYAADQGADVVNLSLGTAVDSATLRDAVQYAFARGVVLVAAAGNGATGTPYYPAAYPEVVAVCATTASDGLWSVSNYGNHMDLCAPGDSIWSPNWTALDPIGSYAVRSGTSMAAPHVSGAAALMLSVNPNLTPAQVHDLLRQSAHDLYTPGWDSYFGAGRLDAYQAVLAAQPSVAPTLTPIATPRPTPGSAVVDQLQSGAANGASFVPKTSFTTGETVYLRAHVVDGASGAPLSGAQVEFTVTQPGDATANVNGTADAAGYAIASYLPSLVGDHTVVASAANLPGYVYVGATSAGSALFSVTAPTPTATPTATWTPTATPSPTPVQGYVQRVNAGGGAYVDRQGVTWAADQAWNGVWGYGGGSAKSTTTAVNLTDDDPLYQKRRDSLSEYRFAVPNGIYQVTLLFAEFDVTKTNTRVMRITMEGAAVESALDIYKLVGKAAALDRTYSVTVSDGQLNILFVKSGGNKNPVVSAVQVLFVGQPTLTYTPTPTPTKAPTPNPNITATPTPTLVPTQAPYIQRVNAGSTASYTGQGTVWPADQVWNGVWGHVSGSAKSTTTAVAETTDDLLHQRWRDSMTEYRFAVPNGSYQVVLRFAEFEVTKATDRLMRITMEGVVMEDALSIYGLVGKATALQRTYVVTVNDGQLNILFAKNGGRKSPVVSALAVCSGTCGLSAAGFELPSAEDPLPNAIYLPLINR